MIFVFEPKNKKRVRDRERISIWLWTEQKACVMDIEGCMLTVIKLPLKKWKRTFISIASVMDPGPYYNMDKGPWYNNYKNIIMKIYMQRLNNYHIDWTGMS